MTALMFLLPALIAVVMLVASVPAILVCALIPQGREEE